MNCFEWENHASEYLDGLLSMSMRKKAETHLAQCLKCQKSESRYRSVISRFSQLPRMNLPIGLRNAPLSRHPILLPQHPLAQSSSTRSNSPWYVRGGFEAFFIAGSIFIALWAIPRIKSVYDESLQRRLQVLDPGDLSRDLVSDKGDEPAALEAQSGEIPEVPKPNSKIVIGDNEIWRFHFKSESPKELEKVVLEKLVQLQVSEPLPKGIIAPGGIQIDFQTPRSTILQIRDEMTALSERYTPQNPTIKSGVQSQAFAWYRNRSRKPIPPGKSRVVIWISQI